MRKRPFLHLLAIAFNILLTREYLHKRVELENGKKLKKVFKVWLAALIYE